MSGPLPTIPFVDIQVAAQQLSVSPWEVVAYAMNGSFRLLLPTPTIKTSPERYLSGLVEIDAAEVARLFKRDDIRSIHIRRIRERGGDTWERITEPHEGIEVTAVEPLILSSELEAFISEADPARPPAAPGTASPASPDRRTDQPSPARLRPSGLQRHDWEGFLAAVTVEIHENGVPETLQVLATKMETWFIDNGDPTKVPDISTIRKKLQPVWQGLRAA